MQRSSVAPTPRVSLSKSKDTCPLRTAIHMTNPDEFLNADPPNADKQHSADEQSPVIRSRSPGDAQRNHRFVIAAFSPRATGERRMRSPLLILATSAVAHAIASGQSGLLINAGLGIALAMASRFGPNLIAYRRREQMG